ncbi:MAG: LysR family transcriptional regulator [Lautropia sp.]
MTTPTRLDRLRIRHLRLLALVAQHGSLTAASELLGVSQSSATKLLQEMEHLLRCSLVDRTTRGGTLTDSGRRALERVLPAIHALDLVAEMVATTPQLPVVRMGILRVAGIVILPDLVKRLRDRGLPLRLQLHEDAVAPLLEQLNKGEIDCIIGRLEPTFDARATDELDITRLDDDPYELACAPQNPLGHKRAVSLRSLGASPWIAAPRPTSTRQAFDMAFMRQGMTPPTPLIESPSFHASFALIDRNPDLLAIAPRSAVRYYAALGKVRAIKLETPFPADRMVFLTRRDLLSIPMMRDLRSTLLQLSQVAVARDTPHAATD